METLRERVQRTNDRQTVPVPTPEWPEVDGELHARNLNAHELDVYQRALSRAREKNWDEYQVRAKLVQTATVDCNGVQVFLPTDVEWLGSKNAKPVDRLWNAIFDLSGQGNEEKEELVKNSDGTLDGDSQLDSPADEG